MINEIKNQPQIQNATIFWPNITLPYFLLSQAQRDSVIVAVRVSKNGINIPHTHVRRAFKQSTKSI